MIGGKSKIFSWYKHRTVYSSLKNERHKQVLSLVFGVRTQIVFLFLFLFTSGFNVFGQITTLAPGSWNSISTWEGGVLPSVNDDVTINHDVVVTSGTNVEINNLTIGSSGKLTINGILTLNGDLTMVNNSPELTTGSLSSVFIFGNAKLSNRVSLDLSSYFIVLGDFDKTGANNQGSLSIDGAHIYVLGSTSSGWESFTACEPGAYDGTTTTVDENCDAGSLEDLINNVDSEELPTDLFDEIIRSQTIDTTTLISSNETVCSGSEISLTIEDSRTPITKISWFRDNRKFINNSTIYFIDTITAAGEYYALYNHANVWYSTNKINITTNNNTNFSSGNILTTNDTICYNGDPSEIGSSTAASGGDNIITYQWQSSTDVGFTSPVIIASNTESFDLPNGLTQNTWYRRLAKDNTCNTTFTLSAGVWAVTVNPRPAAPTFDPTANVFEFDDLEHTAVVTYNVATEVIDWYTTEAGSTLTAIPTATDAGIYTAWAETRNLIDGCTSASRTEVTLEIKCTTATISDQPASQTICAGNSVTFSVTANGPGDSPLIYQWKKGSTNVGTNSPSLTISSVTTGDAGFYTVEISRNCGATITSNPAVLIINPIPVIILDSNTSEICFGDLVAAFGYTILTENPDQYSIDFDTTAEGVGFSDVTNAYLSGGVINVTIPLTATPASYNAKITAKNSTTGCASIDYDIVIEVHALPATGEIIPD